MARRQKISYGGKRYGKGAGWTLNMDSRMRFSSEDRSVTVQLEDSTIEALGWVDSARRNVGMNVIGEVGMHAITANNLRKAVNAIGKKKTKDKLQELYNAGVRRKFRERGSAISRWLPLARSTVQSRTGLLKPYGSNKKSGGVRPLWDTGKLRNVVSEGFYVTDANIYNVQEIKEDKLVFDNIDVGMKFVDRGGSARAAYKNRKGFATFKELMEHQSRWRNIPLTTGKHGEMVGGKTTWVTIGGGREREGTEDRRILKHSDVTKGEFFHYVWLPFSRWWRVRLTESIKKHTRVTGPRREGNFVKRVTDFTLQTSEGKKAAELALGSGGAAGKSKMTKGVVSEKFTGSEEQLARIIKHFKIDPDIANQMTEDWAEKLWIKMKGEKG